MWYHFMRRACLLFALAAASTLLAAEPAVVNLYSQRHYEADTKLYAQFTEPGGGTSVDLQGIKFDTKDGGVLPLEKYLSALLEERANRGKPTPASRSLSPKYLNTLRAALNGTQPSILLDPIRARWRAARRPSLHSCLLARCFLHIEKF